MMMRVLISVAVVLLMIGSAVGAETIKPLSFERALAQADSSVDSLEQTIVTDQERAMGGVSRDVPVPLKRLNLSASYFLWSDYIFRGVNMSEYPGEGRERPVHQMEVTADYLLTDVFGIGGKFFASWASGARAMYGSSRHIQEYRYTPYVFLDVEEIYSRLFLGMNFFRYPQAPPGRKNDAEWWFQIAHNDAWLWKGLLPDNEKPVLNPFLFFAQNVNQASGGMAWLTGISHPFEVPCVPHLTITPQFSVATDHRLVSKLVTGSPSTSMLFLQYGLTVGYDIGGALRMPQECGTVIISGSLYFSDAKAGYIHDELYGGMQVSWVW